MALARRDAVAFTIVIGDRELEAGSLSLRGRGMERSPPVAEALVFLRDACAEPAARLAARDG